MTPLVALYGVGDCYLVCALARAFERHHKDEVIVVVKTSQKCIPELFGLKHEVNDETVHSGETNAGLQRNYPNDGKDYDSIYVHPHFVRTATRLDQLTIKPRVSQDWRSRALMQLPPDAPMEVPPPLDPGLGKGALDTVLITESRSWPNIDKAFWDLLA